jgi:hypothetical protein
MACRILDFHRYLVPQNGMRVNPENTRMKNNQIKMRKNDLKQFPFSEGWRFTMVRALFYFFMVILRK